MHDSLSGIHKVDVSTQSINFTIVGQVPTKTIIIIKKGREREGEGEGEGEREGGGEREESGGGGERQGKRA